MSRDSEGRKAERGLTLIEVLVAFFLLFVVTLAVLQLLSAAYLVNLGSIVRTELTYRAEQVAEQIRIQRYRVNILMVTPDDTCIPVGSSASKAITPSDATCAPVWGPAGANVIDTNSRYTINYLINTNNSVTVQAVPLTTGSNQYLGPTATKAVVYVAQLP